MRNPHAGEPFTTSDDEIAVALEDVSIPTLLLSMVHMSGDERILDGPLRPQGLFLNEVQGYMSEEDKAAVRAQAVEIIKDYRDRGCPEPAPVGPALLKKMMAFLVCQEVPDEYVPMMLEEMELDGRDDRAVEARSTDVDVVVIGLGMSGLLAAIRLQEAGIGYTVVEKNAGVGGTWWENSYPGARVDVGNHFYCYSFEPSDHWTEFFAQQPELQAYFQGVMDKHDVAKNVRFSTEVTAATWAGDRWDVVLDTGEVLRAKAVISAVGQLNRPYVPDVPGDFDGSQFHTSRWDHEVDVTGKRVVMVGAGATGFQLAPTIAPQVEHLTVIQRTAQWMFPNPNYHEQVGPGVRWALRHLPFYGRWYRFLIFWPGCDTGLEAARIDPSFADNPTVVSEVNEFTRQMFTDWIVSQVGDDEELRAKVVPSYPPTAKRTLQDNGSWLTCLTRDNVELVRAGVDRLESGAVVDTDGNRHEADVLVWATGFRVNEPLFPLTITGRDGRDLRAEWGDRPAAYLGMTSPGFPNFFMMYGPGTNLASGGSLIFHSECEIRYIVQCLQALDGRTSMEPRQDKHDEWYARCQAELKTLVWSTPHVEHNFYRNADGDVHCLSPWRLVDFWTWTRTPDLSDFVIQ
ncbi:MAG: putative flavoprotein involved in transport [Frankiales bacterium]|nr:putative flavoprotein involved in transport [Frankiales bacterium]